MNKTTLLIVIAILVVIIYQVCDNYELFSNTPQPINKYIKLFDGKNYYYLSSFYQLNNEMKLNILNQLETPQLDISRNLFNLETENSNIKALIRNRRPLDIVFATQAIENNGNIDINLTHQKSVIGFTDNELIKTPIYYSFQTGTIEQPYQSVRNPEHPNEMTNFYLYKNKTTNLLTLSNIKGINKENEFITIDPIKDISKFDIGNLLQPNNDKKIYLQKIPFKGDFTVNPVYIVLILDNNNDIQDPNIIKNLQVTSEIIKMN